MSDDYQEKSDAEKLEDVRAFAGNLRNKNNGRYFSLDEAVSEVKEAQGVAKTTLVSGKLVGKMGFNVGRFAITAVLPYVLEEKVKQHEKHLKGK